MADEIERKWLIACPEGAHLEGTTVKEIEQIYLPTPEGWDERRIRKSGFLDNYTYVETKKRGKTDVTREEVEVEISEARYKKLFCQGISYIHKNRFIIEFLGQNFELDIYYPEGCNSTIRPYEAILELELQSEEQEVVFPDWIHIIREVTTDSRYKNKNLAMRMSWCQDV